MNDLTVSTPSAPAPLDPRFAPESPGVSLPAIVPSPFALAIVRLLLAFHYANSALDRLFYDTEQFWLRLCIRGLPVSTQIAKQDGAAVTRFIAAGRESNDPRAIGQRLIPLSQVALDVVCGRS